MVVLLITFRGGLMDYNWYLQIISRLFHGEHVSLTVNDFRWFIAHVDEREKDHFLDIVNQGPLFIVMPALFIRDVVHMLKIAPAQDLLILQYIYTGYKKSNKFNEVLFLNQATEQNDRWYSKLCDPVNNFLSLYVTNTEEVTNVLGSLKTIFTVGVGLEIPYIDIVNMNGECGKNLDKFITHISNKPLEIREMNSKHNESYMNICYHCGSGLGTSKCSGCGRTYKDNGIRAGFRSTLPLKIKQYLEEKHFTFVDYDKSIQNI